jgi:2-keto-4-pentenoate hydratase/2-oxohepta-3-ene-1,7-dioic acid hydratase in catechol pathway
VVAGRRTLNATPPEGERRGPILRLVTWTGLGGEEAAILVADDRHVRVSSLNARQGARWPTRVGALVRRGLVPLLARYWRDSAAAARALAEPTDPARWGALFAPTGKLWGIGLNYADHAADLGAARPEEPASFLKPLDCVVAPGEGIRLPAESRRVTAEAELGLVFGAPARFVDAQGALSSVAGAVAVLDQTAEDILQKNPRFLTRAKGFDTFLSFGPVLATLDELGPLERVRVATVLNGRTVRESTVAHMLFGPADLVAFHSRVFTWRPGDLLYTGTPGAAALTAGDVVEAHVADLPPLVQPVLG